MFTFLRNKLSGWKKLAGVELIFNQEGFEIRCCVLEKKKGIISIVKSKDQIKDVNDLKSFLEEDIPIAITLSGKGILNKKLEEGLENDSSKLLVQAIPNAKPNDFYLQVISDSKSKYLSVVRKSIAEEILDLFKDANLPVIALSFGGLVLQSLKIFEGENFNIQAAEHKIDVKDGNILLYTFSAGSENQNFKQKIGSEEISSQFLVAYTSAFQQFLQNPISANHDKVFDVKEDFLEKQMFVLLGWIVLVFFLSLLLINYIAFTWLSHETEKYSVASGLQKSQVVILKGLQKEVGEKDIFLKNAGWMTPSKASYYSDRIATTVPPSVMLLTLQINPLDEKESRDKRKQIFTEGLIVITGTCKRPIELNGWIRRLKDFSWIQKVNVENYNYDSEEKSGTFKVELTL